MRALYTAATGMAAQELSREELAVRDTDYPVTIALRAVKPVSHA